MKHRTLKAVIRSLIISVVIYLILSFLVVMILYENLFSRKEQYEQSAYLTFADIGLPDREIYFDSGGFTLFGQIYNEDGGTGTVILGHGKDGSCEDLLAEVSYFTENGFTAMIFDLTGHGRSDGATQRGLCQAVTDMESAVRFCEKDERLREKKIYLYGFGVSGYGAVMCASMDSVQAVAAISAFENVPKMTLEYALSNMGFLGYLEYPVMLFYQYLLFGDEMNQTAAAVVNQTDTPVLAIHGTSDERISFSGASLIAAGEQMNSGNFQAISVEDGKHRSLLRSADALAYLDEYNEAAYELYRKYNGDVPAYLVDLFYEQYDREKMSELNTEIMDQICDFYRNS